MPLARKTASPQRLENATSEPSPARILRLPEPFWITFDILLADDGAHELPVGSQAITPAIIGRLYGVEPDGVEIFEIPDPPSACGAGLPWRPPPPACPA